MIPNPIKAALAERRRSFGLWCMLPDPTTVEILAGAGYDWMLLDTEHAPSGPLTVLPLLQVLAAYPTAAAVRPAANDVVLIKRFLDLGAQTLIVPYVQTAAEAEAAVRATRYPPDGIRGVSTFMRGNRFGRIPDYQARAATEICVIVQIESQLGLDNLEAIAAVPGVDALFIGPSDLASSIGYGSNVTDPAFRSTVIRTIDRIHAAGKPAGLLTGDAELRRMALEAGVDFLALGVDAVLLSRGAEALLAEFRPKG